MPQYQGVKEFSFTLQSLEFASLVGDFVPVSMKIHRSVGIGWLYVDEYDSNPLMHALSELGKLYSLHIAPVHSVV